MKAQIYAYELKSQELRAIIPLSIWITTRNNFFELPPQFINADKILISIHRIAMIIWIIKTIRRTGANII